MAVWGHLGAVLGPSWGHVGPSWGHLGEILGYLGLPWTILDHVGPSWGHLGAILEPSWVHLVPFWLHFGSPFGSKEHPKQKLKFKTISDTILGPVWSHVGIIDHVWVSCGICVESPGATSPRDVFVVSVTSDIAKPLNTPWFV